MDACLEIIGSTYDYIQRTNWSGKCWIRGGGGGDFLREFKDETGAVNVGSIPWLSNDVVP
jgi:hypothetical protein